MRDIRTKKTRNLSAIGSKNSPNFDSSDFLLAKAPSNASLREPNTKRTTAKITDVVESKKVKSIQILQRRILIVLILLENIPLVFICPFLNKTNSYNMSIS